MTDTTMLQIIQTHNLGSKEFTERLQMRKLTILPMKIRYPCNIIKFQKGSSYGGLFYKQIYALPHLR